MFYLNKMATKDIIIYCKIKVDSKIFNHGFIGISSNYAEYLKLKDLISTFIKYCKLPTITNNLSIISPEISNMLKQYIKNHRDTTAIIFQPEKKYETLIDGCSAKPLELFI